MTDDPDKYIRGYEHGFKDGWDSAKKYFEEQSKSKPMTDEEKASIDDLVEQI